MSVSATSSSNLVATVDAMWARYAVLAVESKGGALKANRWRNLSLMAKSSWFRVHFKDPFLRWLQKNIV